MLHNSMIMYVCLYIVYIFHLYRTYYNPPLLNDHGHILYKEISNDYIMMETFFDLEAVQQYDQVLKLTLKVLVMRIDALEHF